LLLVAILQSYPFRVWVETVSSRLESRYQISASAVYNTFPFPSFNVSDSRQIEEICSQVLKVREVHADTNLGDLYDPLFMPSDLRALHKKIDALILNSYGLKPNSSEADVLAKLMSEYKRLVNF